MLIYHFPGQDMVQSLNYERGVEKLDGYKVQAIKSLRGAKCKFCHKSRAVTACFNTRCQTFYHLPCGIKNGCDQDDI
jgi:hypothetical protein